MKGPDSCWPIDFRFDEEAASLLARLESYNKHLYRPNTYLHKWWARRCGTTFRFILKHLIHDPEFADYYSAGGLEGKIVLDPMFGGGTTLHEAVRLGANVIGLDLDPIPILQARATLLPVNAAALSKKFEELYHLLLEELDHQYQSDCPICGLDSRLQFMLYGLIQRCNCQTAIFLDSTNLRTQPDGSLISICPYCHTLINGQNTHFCDRLVSGPFIYDRKKKICEVCQAPFKEDLTIPYYARYIPVAAARQCPEHGFQFGAIFSSDRKALEKANEAREHYCPQNNLAVFPGPKSSALIKKEIHYYEDLFSSRQLIYLFTAIPFISNCETSIGLNLALLVSTSLDLNSMLCGYKGTGKRRAGAIRHVFSHHAYTFPYTAVENNPIFPSKVSGSLKRFYSDRIERGKAWAKMPKERSVSDPVKLFIPIDGETDLAAEVKNVLELERGKSRIYLKQCTAGQVPAPDGFVDFIITDPPYYDSVQYHDLAPFFGVWLEQLLPPQAQLALDWHYERSLAAVGEARESNSIRDHQPYLVNLSAVIAECQRVLKSDSGRLIFTFHHWNPVAWTALTISLLRSRFKLVNFYSVISENPMSVHIANLRALKHDAILVLASESARITRDWALPEIKVPLDSKEFSEYCAQIMGHILNEDYSSGEILEIWKDFLRE